MSDLVERLRDAHANSQQRIYGSDIFAEAADEIARLRNALTGAHAMIHRQRHTLNSSVDEALRELNDVAQRCWDISHPSRED